MVTRCKKCGRTTNTAVCRHNLSFTNNEAEECYLAWEDGHWVKGCAYEKAHEAFISKATLDTYLNMHMEKADDQRTETQRAAGRVQKRLEEDGAQKK